MASNWIRVEKAQGGRGTVHHHRDGEPRRNLRPQKFRHVLYGESFEVVTDHMALIWLMSLKDPRERLARWIVDMQTFQFNVLHGKGGGELMALPDALTRDTF
jgi:RNase H-like domain found in reverse transcriptase